MRKRIFNLFLLFFPFTYGFTQNNDISDLERKLSDATSDSAKSYLCLRLHDAWFKTNQPKSREYAEKALELVKHSDYWLLKGKTYQALARCERKVRNYRKVFPFDSLSLFCAKKANDTNAVFSANMLLARDNLDAEIFPAAFACLQQCDTISAITKLPAQVAVLNQTLGFYYAQTNRHKLAIPCYEKAIPAFTAIKNDYMVAECKFFMVQSMLALGKTTNAANYVFEALDTYKKLNSTVSQGQCYELLASVYLAEGDVQKGIDYSLQAKDFYRAHNNQVDDALVTFDLVRALLLQKKYTVAATYIAEADSIFNALDYMPGKIRLKTLQGQFYSETGKYELADKYFAAAAVLIKANDLPDVKTEQDKYLAAHQYRLKNYKAADSLTYAYSARQAREKEPEVLAIELNTLYKRNKNLDSTAFKLLKLLYVPGGAEMLKKKLGNKSLLSVLPVDSLLNNNPFSLAPPAYDSAAADSFHIQLQELETRYKTRQKEDSLVQQAQNLSLVKKDLNYKNSILFAGSAFVLLLLAFLWLQVRNRRRAERDKEKIEELQGEIHHRVRNNLGVINRLIDVFERDGGKTGLAALKSRVKAIELLHKSLYQHGHAGHLSLQYYLQDICTAVKATFEDERQIDIHVSAPVATDSKTMELLGLIVNELVTNCFKHAFEGKDAGTIDVAVSKRNENFVLTVTDDGNGMNEAKQDSYGMKLIRGFSHQLGGKPLFRNSPGTQFTLVFIPGKS